MYPAKYPPGQTQDHFTLSIVQLYFSCTLPTQYSYAYCISVLPFILCKDHTSVTSNNTYFCPLYYTCNTHSLCVILTTLVANLETLRSKSYSLLSMTRSKIPHDTLPLPQKNRIHQSLVSSAVTELGTIGWFLPQNSFGAFSARYFDNFPIETSSHSLYIFLTYRYRPARLNLHESGTIG